MDSVPPSSASSKFECKICIEEARHPVVTRCGHLYCWECIYQWIRQSNQQTLTCPVCKAGITQESLIPLYARDEEEKSMQWENLKARQGLPPRPRPERMEPQPNRQQDQMFGNGAGLNLVMGYGLFPSIGTLALNLWDKIVPPTDGRLNNEHHSQKLPAIIFLFLLGVLVLQILFSGSDAHWFF